VARNRLNGKAGHVGTYLRHERQLRAITIHQLAEESGRAWRTISMIERGKTRNPFPETISDIIAALARHPRHEGSMT
jgi:transcriptional regulator with XRE-family HTH domain